MTPTLVIGAAPGLGAHLPYLISMALFVSGVCTFIQSNRIGSVGSGLLSIQGTSFGFLGAILAAGLVNFSQIGGQPLFALPEPFRFGLAFDWGLFIPIAFMYLITAIETTGDTTANSVISGQPVSGPLYMQRLKGAILGDGISSGIAAIFNTFPNTTFSQNNGVIQLTGVASRHVSRYIAGLLVLLGLFPVIGGPFTLIPKPVLGGATLVLFGSIAVAGIRILASQTIDRKAIYVSWCPMR